VQATLVSIAGVGLQTWNYRCLVTKVAEPSFLLLLPYASSTPLDKDVVEAQYPEDLPLDLVAESHIGADKTSISYRKGLRSLGLKAAYTA